MRAGWRGTADTPPLAGIASPAGVVVAAAAAVGWAIGLAVLQPLTEPSGPDAYAENNTYWVRDLRFMAVVAIALGLILAGRGDRWATRAGVAAGALWIGADVVLDRSDLAGWPAAGTLAALGCLAVGAVAAIQRRRAHRPRRRALVAVAAVGAALTPLAAMIESPTDTEPALTPAALVVSGILLALTVGAALAAGLAVPDGTDAATPARLALAVTVLALGAAGLAWTRLVEPHERAPSLLLGIMLLAGLSLLSAHWPAGRPAWDAQGATIAVLAIGYPVLTFFWMFLLMFGTPIATLLTALAGSIPVNSADTDSLYALVGSATGLTIGALLVTADRSPYAAGGSAALPDGS
ncbi:hypothetical protein [Polymorphospora rubra]|uniref:hypothetical protein n=1 Tax=Polymorphospora rubra TaxID=338584 RepID=UPI001BB38C16|nr:hypothetical protein [Polymorphospora rubra]